MLELFKQPWPWYISGTSIAFVLILLLFFGKSFGVSSNLRTICTIAGAGKRVKFFDFDWKTQRWDLLFLAGSVIGGVISSSLLQNDEPLNLSHSPIRDLNSLGIAFNGGLNPSELFGKEVFGSGKGIILLLLGGVLVGFGAKYTGGCTSGHAISGLSNLQTPSLIAVLGFFSGGLIMTHVLFQFF